jgi:hypothetical protein
MASSGISRSFPRLSQSLGQVPTRYSPVRHYPRAETRGPFDLHVLGAPPAFVLSQDQTLSFIPRPKRNGLDLGPRHHCTRPARRREIAPPRQAAQRRPGANPTPAPRPPSPPKGTTSPKGPRPHAGGAASAPATSARMPEPATQGRRPRIPSAVPHLSKEQPGARGYAKSPCSAGKRRLIVAMAVGNKPFSPRGPALTFTNKSCRQH